MKAKLIVNDKEIEVEISEKDLKELTTANKKTGYERVRGRSTYYYENHNGSVEHYRILVRFISVQTIQLYKQSVNFILN